jgi:hypothetical protein
MKQIPRLLGKVNEKNSIFYKAAEQPTLQPNKKYTINPLKTKRILYNIKTQSVPHSKNSTPQFKKPIIW